MPRPFLSVHRAGAAQDLWATVRRQCDEALALGQAFALILRGGGAFADERFLSARDHQRARAFRRPQDRINLILGRTLIHHLVRPAGASPPCPLLTGVHGKPFLADAAHFNLAHSGAWVACAVCAAGPVGVDAETFEGLPDAQSLLSMVAHPAERRVIEGAPPDRRRALFRRCWTRKEAVLKAIGTGLVDDLPGIDVKLAERLPVIAAPRPLRLVDVFDDDAETAVVVALDLAATGLLTCFIDLRPAPTPAAP